jgi:FHS family L-fucose permease-like MFS transporter
MTETTSITAISKKDYFFSITVIGVFFFIFGFVTWLNGILIPFLRTACELNDFEAYFVTFAFYISYFVMALPSSAVLKKTGFKNGCPDFHSGCDEPYLQPFSYWFVC